MNRFEHNGQAMMYEKMGEGAPAFVWAPGWGQDHRAFLGLAQKFINNGSHYLIDFPGFGESPAPLDDWTVGDYAKIAAAFIDSLPAKKAIWIGHSFGCRVGIKLAAGAPERVRALVLVAAAGLPRKRSFAQKAKMLLRTRLFKMLKFLARDETTREHLRTRFGSADYRNAGTLRGTFVKVISENLSDAASSITCPTLLIYGQNDSETPPEMGEEFHHLIRGSQLHILPNTDHYSVIGDAQHQTLLIMKEAFSSWI